MAISPEIKNGSPVVERPTEMSDIPVEVENKSLQPQPTPSTFTPQVTDDKGNPMTQTSQTQQVTITIPKPKESLEVMAKGSDEDASTWWAASLLRAIKKAVHFGWRIVTGKGGGANGTN